MSTRLKQLYLDLLGTVSAIKESGKPVFKYYNIWDEQIPEMLNGKGYSFASPAIFFEIELGNSKPIGFGVQTFPETVVRVRIGDFQLNERGGAMERNLQVFHWRELVLSALFEFESESASSLMLLEDKQDFSHDNYYQYILGFSTNFIDTTGTIFDNPNTGRITKFTVDFIKTYIDENSIKYGDGIDAYITAPDTSMVVQ